LPSSESASASWPGARLIRSGHVNRGPTLRLAPDEAASRFKISSFVAKFSSITAGGTTPLVSGVFSTGSNCRINSFGSAAWAKAAEPPASSPIERTNAVAEKISFIASSNFH
jgi:hypothetical protein